MIVFFLLTLIWPSDGSEPQLNTQQVPSAEWCQMGEVAIAEAAAKDPKVRYVSTSCVTMRRGEKT